MDLTQEQIDRIAGTEYADMVDSLAKPGADILADMTHDRFNALGWALHDMMKAAQVLDDVKKIAFYNKEIEGVELPEGTGSNPYLPKATEETMHLLHMVVGKAGEVGELVEAVLAHVFGDYDLDMENVVEELGDDEFYTEGIRAALGINREDVLHYNKIKLLGKRYASGKYSDEQAINRADKVEEA